MRLVRSDSPEVIQFVRSARTLVCWGWSALALVCVASVPGLLIALLVGLIVSMRAAVWVGVPIILGWDLYILWRGRSRRRNWVLAACDDRVYVRLFVRRVKGWPVIREPDIMVLEASEIASISAHTIQLFLYGPKPKVIEWLVIKPADTVAEAVCSHIRPLQYGSPNICGIRPIDPGKQVFVGNENGALTVEWRWCRPALRAFLQQVARQGQGIAIGPENRSELDLNGIWHGLREEPNIQQRRLLVQAAHLGFGHECVKLLSLYRFGTFPSYQKATAYMAEIEREEAETERTAVPQ